MTRIAWIIALLLQAALLVTLVRRRKVYTLPLFSAWLAFDLARSAAIFAVYTVYGYATSLYAILFAWTEPLDMLLLTAAGIEAAGSCAFGYGLAIALWAGLMLQFPDTGLPLRTPFLTRALVAGACASALVIRCTYQPSVHRVLLTVFCAVDLTTYLAIVMFWPRIDQGAVTAFVMWGQAACLAGWIVEYRR